jgi:5-methylcytosine-specific restriction enzyme subunit McrC
MLLRESKLVDVRALGGDRHWLIPNGRVGAVQFDDLQVDVTPNHKLDVTHLMFLLGYAKDPGFRPDAVVGEAHGDLWPAMAQSLAASGERALTRGLLQGYTSEQEALLTVRGRIAFDEQIRRRPGNTVPIEVRYDDFSPDIAENQILLAAIHLMLGVPRLNGEIRRRLLHLGARFAGVKRLVPGTPTPRWQPTRLNDRYHAALGLAEVLLRHSSTRTSVTGVTMSAFVVVMWKVFEDFVTTALTEALAEHSGYSTPQLPVYLTGAGGWREGLTGRGPDDPHGDVLMNVDVVHFDGRGTPDVVFDAKYKLASSTGRYANADHYQMLAYCTALEVPAAWLIYAGGGADIRRKIKNVGVEVVAVPLNLRQPPEAVLAQVRQVALRALRKGSMLRLPGRGDRYNDGGDEGSTTGR